MRVGAGVPTSRSRRRCRRSTPRAPLDALITGVARVSSLTGPDVHALSLAVRLELPAIVAGGVASIDDLVALRDVGAEAAVVGRAALEGSLDLAAAIASFG